MISTRLTKHGFTALTAIGVAAGLAACTASPVPAPTSANDAVTIYLTRHGETILNELDRVQGWADSPLTESGREDAKNLGEGLRSKGVGFDAAYSADMLRHFDTATLALDAAGSRLKPTRDDQLREMAFGPFEGGSNEAMWNAVADEQGYENQGALFADMANLDFLTLLDSIDDAAGETDLPVETSAEVADRALDALGDIGKDQEDAGGGNVLVVSSGITITCVLAELGADLSGVKNGIENAAVNKLTFDDGEWSVESVNDTSFVEVGASN
ncbi:histidine phosphatase family protein [Saxibacter everestensis]|uniref:Histidine phosphatase family protein n=1 Tax=Saxibacter everestensis TaxID=2909229 RepID=A0ABY8QSA2_9MICO|nr:histidine phosphatase family protein [Brevibacteriaceae bacterium ZFBP1038]